MPFLHYVAPAFSSEFLFEVVVSRTCRLLSTYNDDNLSTKISEEWNRNESAGRRCKIALYSKIHVIVIH